MQTNEAETAAVVAMTPVEFLNRMQAITNAFIEAARSAQLAFETGLEALYDDPACKALEEAQPHLVKAIGEAEMNRMAEALPQ